MYLPVVLSYPEFLKKIGPIIGSDLRFLYTREPDCKKWKFASLYVCLEDTMEDRKLYEKEGVDVDFRDKPTPGERLEVEELNENLEGTRWKIIRFVEQECNHRQSLYTRAARGLPLWFWGCCEDGFILTVEFKETM